MKINAAMAGMRKYKPHVMQSISNSPPDETTMLWLQIDHSSEFGIRDSGFGNSRMISEMDETRVINALDAL